MPPAPYIPDDSRLTPAALDFLHDTPAGIALRHAVAALPDPAAPTVAQVAALRKSYPPDPLHAALILAKLQPKATAKFPGLPYVWATPEALEQATHAHVARYKAARFAKLNPTRIFDLCAGIGGDALAFAQVAPVTAVDLSPTRTTCLRLNALQASHSPIPNTQYPIPHSLDILTTDIRTLPLPPAACIHIDPARRSAGKRSPRYADLIPGPDILDLLLARARALMVKLSPAVDFASLPNAHIEIISHNRTVVQALLLHGFDLPPHERTATILASDPKRGGGGGGFSLTALPLPVSLPDPDRFSTLLAPSPDHPVYLYELDGAITRAGLAQHLADTHHLLPLTIDGGYLLSLPGAPILSHPPQPPFTPFRVHAIVPLSRVPQTLPTLPPAPPGPVEVKARGNLPDIDTDLLQRTWSKAHPLAHTVLLFPPHHPSHHRHPLAALASRSLEYRL